MTSTFATPTGNAAPKDWMMKANDAVPLALVTAIRRPASHRDAPMSRTPPAVPRPANRRHSGLTADMTRSPVFATLATWQHRSDPPINQ